MPQGLGRLDLDAVVDHRVVAGIRRQLRLHRERQRRGNFLGLLGGGGLCLFHPGDQAIADVLRRRVL